MRSATCCACSRFLLACVENSAFTPLAVNAGRGHRMHRMRSTHTISVASTVCRISIVLPTSPWYEGVARPHVHVLACPDRAVFDVGQERFCV